MIYRILADATALVHGLWVVFAVLGGLLVLRWAWLAWLHVPSALWAGAVVIFGWTCPLTPLENRFRRLGGQAGYDTGFLDHYIGLLLYPAGLTRTHQIWMGVAVLALNAAVYGRVLRRGRLRRRGGPP